MTTNLANSRQKNVISTKTFALPTPNLVISTGAERSGEIPVFRVNQPASSLTPSIPSPKNVISTEAAHTVSCAVERPPHFAFAVAVAVAVAVAFAVAFALAFASRYPKASALGPSLTQKKRGVSPWATPSLQQAQA